LLGRQRPPADLVALQHEDRRPVATSPERRHLPDEGGRLEGGPITFDPAQGAYPDWQPLSPELDD
jgi:hypothetical protein